MDNQKENGDEEANIKFNNRKTSTNIQNLQKKVEKNQNQVKEIEYHGTPGSSRKIIKVVQDHVKSRASSIQGHMVEQLETFNNFLRKETKSFSMDNMITDDIDGNKLKDFKRLANSDDVTNAISIGNILKSWERNELDEKKKEDFKELRARVDLLEKERVTRTQTIKKFSKMMNHVLESFQEEEFKTDQLQNRLDDFVYNEWNELTESHHSEFTTMSDDFDRTFEGIDCVEYRFTERSAELEESVINLITRVSKTGKLQTDQQFQPLDECHEVHSKIFSTILSFILNVSLFILFAATQVTELLKAIVSNQTLFVSILMALIIYLMW